jgi:hypothetical protein
MEESYQVYLYNTGKAAEYVKILHPYLVLIDVNIVGFEKTGAEICSEIKSLLAVQSPPILLLSREDGFRESHVTAVQTALSINHLKCITCYLQLNKLFNKKFNEHLISPHPSQSKNKLRL